MNLVKIYCPRCDYRDSVEAEKFPKGIEKTICPNCQMAFLILGTPEEENNGTPPS